MTLASGWFQPSRCNTGYQCGCDCRCPVCSVVNQEDCRLYWECICTTDSIITLSGGGVDYGELESTGSVAITPGEEYTFMWYKPDSTCATRSVTILAVNDCPCSTGCMNGEVVGAKKTATITVSAFGSGSADTILFPPDTIQCTRHETWDYTPLNHTASFPIKQHYYTNTEGVECVLEYIEPTEYYIGDITNTKQEDGGSIASVTFAVYGKIHPTTHLETGLTIGGSYQLRFVHTSSTPGVSNCFQTTGATIYAEGDSATPSDSYSAHIELDPADHSVHGTPGGTYGNLALFGSGDKPHPVWCWRSYYDSTQEALTQGYPAYLGAPALQPDSMKGLFTWEALY